ncbi:MAG: DUF2656 domain-containing protein [Synechococcaceae bacterium WB5_2A_257]|nr:DUF2656 domain-containing protein [Synechococcaceae bacterium WB5_2A_257]
MTIFIVSHNLQINSAEVPAFSAAELADLLQNENPQLTSAIALNHPHWMLKVESELDVNNMAEALLDTWRLVRLKLGHTFNHTAIALGGRKDDNANPSDSDAFLRSINWDALKSGRPVDAVFEKMLKGN